MLPLTSRAAQVTSRAAQGLACAQRWKSAFSLLDRQQGSTSAGRESSQIGHQLKLNSVTEAAVRLAWRHMDLAAAGCGWLQPYSDALDVRCLGYQSPRPAVHTIETDASRCREKTW